MMDHHLHHSQNQSLKHQEGCIDPAAYFGHFYQSAENHQVEYLFPITGGLVPHHKSQTHRDHLLFVEIASSLKKKDKERLD